VKFSVLTIFPEMIRSFLEVGLIQKAIQKKLIEVAVHDLRSFSHNKHRKVDDRPFGGGPGMVMMPDPLFRAVEHIRGKQPGRVILFSAYGAVLNQAKIKRLALQPHLILICGRYEGVDQRAIDQLVDEEVSLGKYVVMGGEVAAEVLIEAVSRMVVGVVGNFESVQQDTFFRDHQFAFPQYTQPRSFRGLDVPETLLTGNHQEIQQWRRSHQKARRKRI